MTSAEQPRRDYGWAAVAVVAVLAVTFAAWSFSAVGSARQRAVISDLALLPVSLVVAVLCRRASRHPALDAATARAWRRVGYAFFAYWTGEAQWTWFEVVRREEPFPSTADIGYLVFYPLLVWALLSFPRTARTRPDRIKLMLDSATVVLGGGMVVWYLVVGPIVRSGGVRWIETVLSVAYPVGDVLVVFGLVVVLLRGAPSGSSLALKSLVGGATLFVAADLAYARLALSDSYAGGDWPDVLWMAALALSAAAPQLQWWRATVEPAPDEAQAPPPVSKLPYLAVVAGYGLVGFVGYDDAGYPLGGLLLGAGALTVLVMFRQVTALQENARLMVQLHELAVQDPLTGLANRRCFFNIADREIARAQRHNTPVALLMIDVDRFKQINDTYGHAGGDDVLRDIARRCQQELRSIDVLARFGGDELVAFLPDTDETGGAEVAGRIERSVGSAPVSTDRGPALVTVSLGVSAARAPQSVPTLLAAADRALYEAKEGGRSCVRVAAPASTTL